MENNSTKKEKKNNIFIYILLVIITLSLLVLAYLFINQKKEMDEIVDNLNEEKTILTEEYKKLLDEYDSIQINEIRGFGTVNYIELLDREKEKVAHLIEEIKIIKATNTAKIREYQKELTTLRSVMQSYLIQIDSLNTRNEELVKENKEIRQRNTQIETSYKKIEVEKAVLEKKVSIASQLEITNTVADGLGSNDRKNDRSNRVAKIRVCFTVLKNITAPVGMKKFYIRIERPDGQLLMHSKDDLFTYENSKINYSAFREFEYGGEEIDVCIFYTVDTGELMKGKYLVDIFADGFHIGNVEFSLK